MGAIEVYDYTGGKDDWEAAGLPMEPTVYDDDHALGVARIDIACCAPDATVAELVARAAEEAWETCVVVNEQEIVLGRVHAAELDAGDTRAVADVMDEGPQTVRADATLDS